MFDQIRDLYPDSVVASALCERFGQFSKMLPRLGVNASVGGRAPFLEFLARPRPNGPGLAAIGATEQIGCPRIQQSNVLADCQELRIVRRLNVAIRQTRRHVPGIAPVFEVVVGNPPDAVTGVEITALARIRDYLSAMASPAALRAVQTPIAALKAILAASTALLARRTERFPAIAEEDLGNKTSTLGCNGIHE